MAPYGCGRHPDRREGGHREVSFRGISVFIVENEEISLKRHALRLRGCSKQRKNVSIHRTPSLLSYTCHV